MTCGALPPTLHVDATHGRRAWMHTAAVHAVAFSADGTSLWSGGLDGVIAVWPLRGRGDAKILKTGGTTINALGVSTDGRLVVSGGEGSQGADDVTLWDPATYTPRRGFRSPGRGVNTVDPSADGQVLLTGGDDRTVMVWALADASAPRVLKGHRARVLAVRLSADGQRALSASADRTIRVWDLARGVSRELSGHTAGATGVAFLADGRRAVSTGMDGALIVWDLDSGQPTLTLHGHIGGIRALALVPGRDWAVTGGIDGTVRVWDLAVGSELHELEGHRDAVNSVAVSPDGRTIASGSEDGAVKLWSTESGAEIVQGSGHAGAVTFIASAPGWQAVVTGGDDRALIIWALSSTEPAKRWQAGFAPRAGIAVPGPCLLIAGDGACHEAWALPPGEQPVAQGGPFDGDHTEFAFRPGGQRLVTALLGRGISEVDLEQARMASLIPPCDAHRPVLAIAADAVQVIVGLRGHEVLVQTPGQAARTLPVAEIHPQGGVLALALAADGRLAAGLGDGRIVIVDTATGVIERAWPAHAGAVAGLAFVRGAERLVTAGMDGTICAWRCADGALCGSHDLAPLNDHGTVVTALADGERAGVGTARGVVLVVCPT